MGEARRRLCHVPIHVVVAVAAAVSLSTAGVGLLLDGAMGGHVHGASLDRVRPTRSWRKLRHTERDEGRLARA